MFLRFYEAFITFPKWFQYGLCPVAYVVVGIFISHLYRWKMVKTAKIGCGGFTPRLSWEGLQCPVENLCDSHSAWQTFYGVMTAISVIAWPIAISVNVGIVVLVGVAVRLYKSFKWFWNIPKKTLKHEWEKLDQMIGLINNKYMNQARVEIKE